MQHKKQNEKKTGASSSGCKTALVLSLFATQDSEWVTHNANKMKHENPYSNVKCCVKVQKSNLKRQTNTHSKNNNDCETLLNRTFISLSTLARIIFIRQSFVLIHTHTYWVKFMGKIFSPLIRRFILRSPIHILRIKCRHDKTYFQLWMPKPDVICCGERGTRKIEKVFVGGEDAGA